MVEKYTMDTHETVCKCGEKIHLTRRGPIALIPHGHRCPAKEIQDAVLRTIRAEEACGIKITLSEVARRLRDWGIGTFLDVRS